MSTRTSTQKEAKAKAQKLQKKVAADKKAAALKMVRTCVSALAQSRFGKWVTTTVNKTAALGASFVTTTVSFGVMAQVTLWLDEHWLHHVFEELAGADPVLGWLFHAAKYAALALELYWWLRGLSRDCEDHANHSAHNKPNNPASSTSTAKVVETEEDEDAAK